MLFLALEKQTVTGSPTGTSEKFEYALKALTTGAPMPVGSSGDSYRFTLNGNESKDLVITYDTVDTYKYQLSQVVTSDKKDYDRQVYTIENYVLQNGNDDIIIRTGVKRSDGNIRSHLEDHIIMDPHLIQAQLVEHRMGTHCSHCCPHRPVIISRYSC